MKNKMHLHGDRTASRIEHSQEDACNYLEAKHDQ